MRTSASVRYVLAGAAVGLAYAAFTAMERPAASMKESDVGIAVGVLIGGVWGFVMFQTRRWKRFGRDGWYARWAIAGAASLGSVTAMLYIAAKTPLWLVLAASWVGLVIGLCFAVEFRGTLRSDGRPNIPPRG